MVGYGIFFWDTSHGQVHMVSCSSLQSRDGLRLGMVNFSSTGYDENQCNYRSQLEGG